MNATENTGNNTVHSTGENTGHNEMIGVRDFLKLTSDDTASNYRRLELVDGRIHQWPSEGLQHKHVMDRLIKRVIDSAGSETIIRIQSTLQLGNYCALQPDICLLRRRDEYYDTQIPAAADTYLVIEVAETTLDFDQNTKAQLYARYQVPDYLILDIRNDRLLQFSQPHNRAYSVSQISSLADKFTLSSLPNVTLDFHNI